jgi:DNA-binding CsgD family transcriptional regulator
MKQRILIDRENLRRRYIDDGLTIKRIAAELGCSTATISNYLRRYGIRTRPSHFRARDIPRAQLIQLYSVEQLPLAAIAVQLGVSVNTIGNRLRAYAIPRRPR